MESPAAERPPRGESRHDAMQARMSAATFRLPEAGPR